MPASADEKITDETEMKGTHKYGGKWLKETVMGHWLPPLLFLALGVSLGLVTAHISTSGNGDQSVIPGESNERRGHARSSHTRSQSSERSPKEAVRHALNSQHRRSFRASYEERYQAYKAIRSMNVDEIQLALAELEGKDVTHPSAGDLRVMLMRRWAKMDGRAATQYALSAEFQDKPGGCLGVCLREWMGQDPMRAYEWFKDNRGEFGSSLGGEGMDIYCMAVLARHDMEAAFDEIGGRNKSARIFMMDRLATSMARDPANREAFFKRLQQLEDGDCKGRAMERLIDDCVETDPQAAARYVEELGAESPHFRDVKDKLVDEWSELDPDAYLQWEMGRLEDGKSNIQEFADSLSLYASNHGQATDDWLEKQPTDLQNDDFRAGMAKGMARRVVKSTWSPGGEQKAYSKCNRWVREIQDPQKRREALQAIYNNLLKHSTHRREIWLNQLDPQWREELDQIR